MVCHELLHGTQSSALNHPSLDTSKMTQTPVRGAFDFPRLGKPMHKLAGGYPNPMRFSSYRMYLVIDLMSG